MNSAIKYTLIFIIFSVLGWFYENKIIQKSATDTLLYKISGLKLPLLTIYGIGGVIITYLVKFIPQNKPIEIIKYIILVTVIINLMECVVGQLSYEFNKYQTWNYHDMTLPMCNGYISLTTFLGWMLMITIIFVIILVHRKITLK